jgi:phosphoribosylglycinamide formyltransferase-1
MTFRVAVLASGTGSNMDSLIAKCQNGLVGAEVSMVLSDKPDAACLRKAKAAGVPAVLSLKAASGETREQYDERLVEALEIESPDLVVLAGFMRILTPVFCAAFAGRIINIHPALLPKHKGAHGIRYTLAAGDELAGCTTHFVTAELDGGPIILQASRPVFEADTEETLAARVLELEHRILPRTVDLIANRHVILATESEVALVDSGSWVDELPSIDEATFSLGY